MLAIVRVLATCAAILFKSRRRLEAENLFLRLGRRVRCLAEAACNRHPSEDVLDEGRANPILSAATCFFKKASAMSEKGESRDRTD
jgi:hypothetical protein